MSDAAQLRERLEDILHLLERASRRFGHVTSAEDFQLSDEGLERLDAICMVLIATGEAVRRLDRETSGTLFARYSEVPWASVKGIRDVIAHGYFDVDAEQIFNICKSDLPQLIATLRRMITESTERQ
jgi:uncharacterized protein with HEPN domain